MNGGKGYSVISHKKIGREGRIEKEDDYPLYSAPFYPDISRMKRIR
jgi:hypothetical protein